MEIVQPEVLMGEGGACGFLAMVILAQLTRRNSHMNGWDDNPTLAAMLAGILWPYFPDMTGGAQFVFSITDLSNQNVQKIISGRKPIMTWPCSSGMALHFY